MENDPAKEKQAATATEEPAKATAKPRKAKGGDAKNTGGEAAGGKSGGQTDETAKTKPAGKAAFTGGEWVPVLQGDVSTFRVESKGMSIDGGDAYIAILFELDVTPEELEGNAVLLSLAPSLHKAGCALVAAIEAEKTSLPKPVASAAAKLKSILSRVSQSERKGMKPVQIKPRPEIQP